MGLLTIETFFGVKLFMKKLTYRSELISLYCILLTMHYIKTNESLFGELLKKQ